VQSELFPARHRRVLPRERFVRLYMGRGRVLHVSAPGQRCYCYFQFLRCGIAQASRPRRRASRRTSAPSMRRTSDRRTVRPTRSRPSCCGASARRADTCGLHERNSAVGSVRLGAAAGHSKKTRRRMPARGARALHTGCVMSDFSVYMKPKPAPCRCTISTQLQSALPVGDNLITGGRTHAA
jgi:hypothetical protein